MSIRLALGVAVALAAAASPAWGQERLALKTSAPAAEIVCSGAPAGTPQDTAALASEADAGEVERLRNAATQAMILGDLDGALEFLNRALGMDPTAAEAVYLRGRILHQQGRYEPAADAFCRYLALEPAGPSAGEARQRLRQAADTSEVQQVAEAFRRGVDLHAAGRMVEAERAFTQLIAAHPSLPSALYNRGLIRAQLRRETDARADLEAYLRTSPDAADAANVRGVLAQLRRTRTAELSPGGAFARGLFPGGGQYYTGRPAIGVAVTAFTAGAVAAGILYERTTIDCLDVSLGSDCPEELIASRETDRPLLVPALGAAAGVALLAAVEAALYAGRERGEGRPGPAMEVGGGIFELDGRVQLRGERVRLGIMRLTF